MYDLEGWVQVDCTVADALFRAMQTPERLSGRGGGWGGITIGGTLTDRDGLLGEPTVFTELVWRENGYAVLREYLWPAEPSRKCEHWVPGPGFDHRSFAGAE